MPPAHDLAFARSRDISRVEWLAAKHEPRWASAAVSLVVPADLSHSQFWGGTEMSPCCREPACGVGLLQFRARAGPRRRPGGRERKKTDNGATGVWRRHAAYDSARRRPRASGELSAMRVNRTGPYLDGLESYRRGVCRQHKQRQLGRKSAHPPQIETSAQGSVFNASGVPWHGLFHRTSPAEGLCGSSVQNGSWRATGVCVNKLNLFPVSLVAFSSCLCSPATCYTRDSAPHMMHDDCTWGFNFCWEQEHMQINNIGKWTQAGADDGYNFQSVTAECTLWSKLPTIIFVCNHKVQFATTRVLM